MKGAREFYKIIKEADYRRLGGLVKTDLCTHGGDSNSYRFNNIVFTTASHARGYTFEITLVDGEEKLQVYGVTGGNRGWTETYGWTHKGSWVKPILLYLRNLEKEIAAYDERLADIKRSKEREENKKIGTTVDKFNGIFKIS